VLQKFKSILKKNYFNITSDGRQIIGLDSEKLLDALLEIEPNIIFILLTFGHLGFLLLAQNRALTALKNATVIFKTHLCM
jgi:hypothetical protein